MMHYTQACSRLSDSAEVTRPIVVRCTPADMLGLSFRSAPFR